MHRITVLLSLMIVLSFINTTISKTSLGQWEDNETMKLRSSYVTTVTSSLSSTARNTLETKYLPESKLVQNLLHGAYMNGFDLFDFLGSLQPSDCLQICFDEVASMLEQPFAGQHSVDEVGNICSHFDIFQRCLHHNASCKDALLDVTTTIIDYLCTFNQDEFEDLFPCLYGHSAVIYLTCDNQCKMGEILSKASKKKKDDVTNILDSNGNKLLQVPNLYNLCSASACFINCTQNLAEKECSIGHSTLLHKIVAAVVNHTIKIIPTPAMKSNDAYTLLVSSILPNECQRLKLLPQDLVLTTPMTDFIDGVKYESTNSVIQQKTANSEENDAIRTILNNYVENQTNSVYMQILSLNGRQMKLQCQMIDLETGQEATVADIARLMTTEAKNILNEFGLRSAEDEQILANKARYDNRSGLQDHKAIGSKSEMYAKASSDRLFPSGVLTLLLMLLF
ncbi:Chondroitin proteoglycan 4 family protein [Acanthocheilonema viteae]